MENKKLIKFTIVALFTVAIQLISVYATPDSNDQIVSETSNVEETTIASLND